MATPAPSGEASFQASAPASATRGHLQRTLTTPKICYALWMRSARPGRYAGLAVALQRDDTGAQPAAIAKDRAA